MVQHVLQQATLTQALTAEAENSSKRDEKLAVVVWSDAAWAKRKDLSSTLGFFSGVPTTRILQGGRHGVISIHHCSGKSKRKARSSLRAVVQALADAEQELYFTRVQMAEFLGFLVNLVIVDETVQRVDGVSVIDAKAICDSMYVWSIWSACDGGKTSRHSFIRWESRKE